MASHPDQQQQLHQQQLHQLHQHHQHQQHQQHHQQHHHQQKTQQQKERDRQAAQAAAMNPQANIPPPKSPEEQRYIPPVNYRDVGKVMAKILDSEVVGHAMPFEQRETLKKKIAPGKLLRGGHIDFLDDPRIICNPRTVLNLRFEADRKKWEGYGVRYIQLTAGKAFEKYNIETKEVRDWMVATIKTISFLRRESLPLFVHCRYGKDRTGIVVACILLLLGFPKYIIIMEYLQSVEGVVKQKWIEKILNEMPDDPILAREQFPGTNFENLEHLFR